MKQSRKGFSGGYLALIILLVGGCFTVTLFWPRDAGPLWPAPRGGSAGENTAYWAQKAQAEGEAESQRLAALQAMPSARTEMPTGWNGELDLAPAARKPVHRPSGNGRIYWGCDAARADGRINIPVGDPAYHPDMDGDADGIACEPYPRR